MARKPLHNFALPNPNLEWKIKGRSVKTYMKGQSPSPPTTPYPPPINHSEPNPEVMLEDEDEASKLEDLDDLPLIKYYNKNFERIRKVETEEDEKKGEGGVLGEGEDEANRPRLVIKLPSNKNFKSVKGKGMKRGESKNKNGENKDLEKKGKEVVVDAKAEDFHGKRKEGEQMKKGKEKVNDSIDGLEESMKSRNLRTRTNKSVLKLNIGGSNGLIPMKDGKGKTQPSKSKDADIWEKIHFNPTLTQREIEEDLYSMGVKSRRKVKRRPKSLQKIIDEIYPGNNLNNISAATYEVSANSMMKQG